MAVIDFHPQNMTLNTDDTLATESLGLDGVPKMASDDDNQVLPIYEDVNVGRMVSSSRVPCSDESTSFTTEEYANLAEHHSVSTPIYTSLITTPEQL